MKLIENLGLVELIKEKFDYTLNSHTLATLLDLVGRFPIDKQEVFDRQKDLKVFQENIGIAADYTYDRIYFNDMYAYLNTGLEKFEVSINVFRSKERLQFLRPKALVTVLIFRKIYSVVKQLKTLNFSTNFKNRINFLYFFFESLKFESYHNTSKIKELSYLDIISINDKLFEKYEKGDISLFFLHLHHLESYLSLSLGIEKNSFQFPYITDNELSIDDFTYPILKNPISNTFCSNSNVAVLTGANMSGKSTFFRGLSLCVYLSNIGLAVPAKSARIPLFDKFFFSVNKNDNVKKGYSHFMQELVYLKEAFISLKNGAKCFCVFDEIFNGTNVNEANALLDETIRGFLKYETSKFFISTHNLEIKYSGSENDVHDKIKFDTYYLECIVSDGSPIYTFKLKRGHSDIRVASLLFHAIGIRALLP